MAVVIDASTALSFLATSQSTPASEAFRLGAAVEHGLSAPFVFQVEMRHALLKLERQGLVSATALDADLAALETAIEVAPAPSDQDFRRLVALARTEALGLYDAAYIDLAIIRGEGLASRDAAMLDVAARHGVIRHDLR
jgi:predicted nucleic acid-binding protein